MGLLDMLIPGAATNPFYQAFNQNRNAVTEGFAGMVGAGNDPRMALTGFVKGFDGKGGLMHGRSVDEEQAIIRQKQAEQQAAIEQEKQQQNQTIVMLQQKAQTDPRYATLLQGVQSGALTPGDAFKQALDYQKPQDGFTLGTGDVRYDANGNVLAQGPTVARTEAAPTGYRYGTDGNLSFIPGGPADPSTAGKTTEATRRNQQLAKVITPELQSLIGNGTPQNPGTFDALANPQDQMRAMGGDAAMALGQGPSPAYQQARNSLTTIVASYLYSVSGATANPGEVEKQVEVLTPKFGESAQSVAAKKQRLQAMVEAVQAAATGTPISIDQTQPQGGAVDYKSKYGLD